MRRNDKEVKDPEIIEQVLKTAQICRVGFLDEVYPYIVPMNYGYADNHIYFHCAPEGKKIELIRRNNKVCFEIELFHDLVSAEVSCDWTTKFRSVIGYGLISILQETLEKIDALDIIMKQHGKLDNEYNERLLNRVGILKLEIKSVTCKQSG